MAAGHVKYTFPSGYGVECRLVAIDASFVPIVAGLLTELAEPGRWATDEDYYQAYNAIGDILKSMANNCATEIVQSVNRLYMLIDSIYNGAEYGAPGGVPEPLPVVPEPAPDDLAMGLRRQLLNLQGVKPSAWPFTPGTPVTLADVEKALRVGSESDATILDDLADALDTVDDAGDIFNTIRGFIDTMLNGSLEGGQLAVITAMALTQSMFFGLQAQQLDTLNATMAEINAKLADAVPVAPEGTVVGRLTTIDESLAPGEI